MILWKYSYSSQNVARYNPGLFRNILLANGFIKNNCISILPFPRSRVSISVAHSKSSATSIRECGGTCSGARKDCATALVSASINAKACVACWKCAAGLFLPAPKSIQAFWITTLVIWSVLYKEFTVNSHSSQSQVSGGNTMAKNEISSCLLKWELEFEFKFEYRENYQEKEEKN